jgi:hypothetical protein
VIRHRRQRFEDLSGHVFDSTEEREHSSRPGR